MAWLSPGGSGRAAEEASMNIDIQTEVVAMRPEWHRTIVEWLRRTSRP
jgi:hypothetical protein